MSTTSCKKTENIQQDNIPVTGMYVSSQFAETNLNFNQNIVYSTRPNFRNNQYTSINTKIAEMASSSLQMAMDVALPPNATAQNTQPLIIFIHGGGFVTGDKSDMAAEAITYARAGYVVASINYRLTQNQSNDTTRYLSRIHALEDVGNAIRFLKANRAIYFIDTTRILTIGSSAGGGLSLINAIEKDAATSSFNQTNFSTSTNAAIATGATLRLNDLNGITPNFDSKDAPVLMFHANPIDGGTGATWDEALATQNKINTSGNSCTLVPQPDMSHTVTLDLEGKYWPQLKPFIYKNLRLKDK